MSESLKHAISLTNQKDTDELECCLARICKSFFSEFNLSIYKISRHNQSAENAYFQRFNYNQRHDKGFCFLWDKDIQFSHISHAEKFSECAKEIKPVAFVDNNNLSHLIIPYTYKGIVHGLIEITHESTNINWPEDFIELIVVYENIYHILNDNERDQLTGLYNRKTFDKKLSKLLTLQSKKQQRYSNNQKRNFSVNAYSWLVAIDIDHFKQVNDKFGHLYGDEVLLRLSQLMQESFRSMDLIFRFGGEEFILVLEPTTLPMATRILERFRQTVSDFDFPLVGHITISTGFAAITKGDYPAHVLDNADKALYYAKENGRDCTHNFEQLVEDKLLEADEENHVGDIDLF